jgi:hypothetical protein
VIRPLAALLPVALLLVTMSVGSTQPGERVQAVFVLGEDAPAGDAFHTAAAAYFRQRIGHDDLLVTTARSWSEVRELLARSGLRGESPWGRVVLVAHGSQWTGLSLPLFPGQAPPLASQIEAVLDSQAFPPLPADVFDRDTALVFESCGLGRRVDLIALYARLLAGNTQTLPSTHASTGLVEFGVRSNGLGVAEAWRIEHDYTATVRPSRAATRPTPSTRDATAPTIHVELVVTLETGACHGRPASRLAEHPAVRQALNDHGLQPARLHWRIQRDRQGDCQLIGRAEIVTDRALPLRRIGPGAE